MRSPLRYDRALVLSVPLLVGALTLALAPSYAAAKPRPAPTAARVFYVDPVAGSDASTGRATTAAWRTLYKVNATTLLPGDTVRLRAGATHVGDLVLLADGTASKRITVNAYGTGTRPLVQDWNCVRIGGDHITVTGIRASGCDRAGFSVEGAHDVVSDVEASGSVTGVWVKPGSYAATVTGSYIHDNDLMHPGTPGPDDDYGAFGVEVNGDGARVTRNRIDGHHAVSADYGYDGAAVEIYQASGTVVDHNTSTDNLTFTELGGNTSTDNRYGYNRVTSSLADSSFLMTRGAGQVWGPVLGTVAEHNTVRLTGARSFGFGCYSGCTPQHLVLRRNIVDAAGWVGYADGSFTSTDNVYRGELWFGLGAGDSTAAPGFVDAAAGDLRLTASSPAVDRVAPSTTYAWAVDVAGAAIPRDGDGDGVAMADVGAYER